MRFVDTNVLLYAISRTPADKAKREKADIVLQARDLALSAQVLQEFYVQATRATRQDRVTAAQAASLVAAFTRFPVQPITTELVLAAMTSSLRYQLSYWDAAIVEAARMLSCTELLSEDLSPGQDFDGVSVVNPFR